MIKLIKTPFGWCGIVFDKNIVKRIILPSRLKNRVLKRLQYADVPDETEKSYSLISEFLKDLTGYFNGEKVDFRTGKILTSFPSRPALAEPGKILLDLTDYSDFERSVYWVLRSIPYGSIKTYKWVAEKAGCPRGCRAVGNALAKNPLPIIIPCHRVVKSDGSLGNFSAIDGVKLKEKLLRMEGALC